ncbi:hypothetical protein BDM02DRAFT_1511226 [Thelephora ganbajun]|uniref:Uncharacterized protein n=1 Tax=Thelephora ganbajun TaxID=370292 RepID=A0ACB6Z233_THEGA|nr:hypothetical protein BDM02DRAFT_1511226 [Thelephora ganbajun]
MALWWSVEQYRSKWRVPLLSNCRLQNRRFLCWFPKALYRHRQGVTTANWTNQYILDFFLVSPVAGASNSGVGTSRSVPSSTSSSSPLSVVTHSTPVGAIVGGVVGGVAVIAILVIALFYFLKKRSRNGQAYYFEKHTPGDILAGEDHVEPFNATPATPAPSSPGFNRPGPQSAYSDSSSNQPLNPSFGQAVSPLPSQYSQSGPSEAGLTHVTSTTAQPRTGKAALMAQQYQNVQQPIQYEDSGVRFNENGEQEAGPSNLPHEVPPSYTPQ